MYLRGKVMNKAQLIDAVADATDISKASASRAVESVLDIITSSLKKGDSVTLVGFGTFTTRKRAARSGRNPRTGATIQIPASTLPVFKPGKALKDAVN
ncbi:MAG: HU family DNA-binding protein [Gammaproteobacteria bacterium]|nr:HU family DNA-binding protein [Gammaproteobacteria bacterium]